MSTPINAAPQPAASCCDAPPATVAVPRPIANPPAATALRYRIGTFTGFRRAMLDSLRRAIDADTAGTDPFVNWHEGTDGDYQTILIELWAYLADILTFYQERIANEAYLPTATQRDSLLRLVALIDYRPSPGAGAVTLEAFAVDKGKSLTIAAGSRTGSKPAPGAPGVVFETTAAITARGEHSAIPLAVVTPTTSNDQFAKLTGKSTYKVVLEGTGTLLAAGDYVLIVGSVTIDAVSYVSATTLRQLTGVNFAPTSGTTTVTWAEDGTQPQYTDVSLYALRLAAAPFGNNAPGWISLPPSLRLLSSPALPGPIPYPQDWDDPTNASSFLPIPGDSSRTVFLDSVQSQLAYTTGSPGWVVLLTDNPNPSTVAAPGGLALLGTQLLYGVFGVVDARPVSKAALAVSGRVTRLTLDPTGNAIPPSTFPLRNTLILTGAVPLTLATALPGAVSATGQELLLGGLYPNLQAGQTAIVQGTLYDATAGQPTATVQAEAVVIGLVGTPDPVNNVTTVTLRNPLAGNYATATTVLMANVATANQGETIVDEVLGSGDGSAFQSYPLSKGPLTYLPANQNDGTTAVQSTLKVVVNGVAWEEVPSLTESLAGDQVFATAEDETGATTVSFGDGFSGARPPSGQNNIHARYRKGLGTSGNLPAGSIIQLIDTVPGLRSVTNPLVSSGGSDPSRADQIRTLAPSGVRSFGRAVSVADYAALALGYPGVSKASAAWVSFDQASAKTVPEPYVQLTVATNDQVRLGQQPAFTRGFRVYLDRRRDANVPLRLRDYTPAYIDMAATIDVQDRYPRTATLARVQTALRPGLNPDGTPGFFAFDRLQFGQGLSLAAVYAAIQAIPGVRDAVITTFLRLAPGAVPDLTAVSDGITLGPTELLTIVNDPNHPETGLLTLNLGEGGFIDT